MGQFLLTNVILSFRTVTVLICCVQITVYLWYNIEIILDLQPNKPVCHLTNHTELDGILPGEEIDPVLSCSLPNNLDDVYYSSQTVLDFGTLNVHH